MREAVTSGGYFVRQRTLATENLALKDELAQYREKAAGYDVLYQENMQLRTMLHLADKHQGITAPVVSSTGSSPYGTFLIGAGTNDPVREGDVVLTDGDFVVGLVTDVLGRTSAVRALFSAGVQTDVIIAGAAVTAVGDGGGNAHASVPRGIVVHEGDAVIAGIYGGRAIGVVGKVESAPTSADQTVYIRLPVDLSSLRYVYILHS
ncbi:rod shape-determining protein MreC [Candidatus Kaiserbacteria bacterium]|nr:rod shape-determining protein MreC [Candidatus Kaiserbacteria bacterium]